CFLVATGLIRCRFPVATESSSWWPRDSSDAASRWPPLKLLPSGHQGPFPVAMGLIQRHFPVSTEGAMRPSDTVSEASPGSRLLVQAGVQAKPAAVSPLQITGVQVSQQPNAFLGHLLLPRESPPPWGCRSGASRVGKRECRDAPLIPPGSLHSQRSPVPTSSSGAKTGPGQQLQVHGVQPVPAAPEVPVQHVYPGQVQYVEGSDAAYAAGTIGNSKYHYYGLRIKANSPLLRLMEDQQHLAMRQQPFSQKQRLKTVQKVEGMTNGVAVAQQQSSGLSDISTQVQQYQQFLDASRALADFSELELQGKALPDGVSAEDLKAFQVLYREHCEAIVDVMINLQFTLVETLWKTFWRFNLNQPSEAAPVAVGRCEDRMVQRLEQDFKMTLQQQNSLEQWAAWLDGVVTQVLKPYQGSQGFPKAAKLFLLKWSFYSSMVIRDLTLRSATSFGSFHLIRLLYDEYMYYLVEHRVAQAKFANLTSSLNSLDPDKGEER
ncbi:PREDICTED: MHC class II regulatory factor RFX1, partial [Tinamus guttatus]|uniref:MHC class II regulatory factor RFX1 n=1 Tax=Tinamus guttatus TaxID=94827 RepID=UPI00052EDBF6